MFDVNSLSFASGAGAFVVNPTGTNVTTLRIGTMGLTASPLYVLPTLSALELTLRDLGYKCEPGACVAA